NGTSMASPQVANLAAKMLVVNPDLKPEQIKKILADTATPSDENPDIFLIHSKHAVETAAKLRKDYKSGLLQQYIVSTK
ncbi:MAG TPA: S8 family serine peptidase, partial [Cyclobacteriaceae bacterium]|nr:S8 family serine peptidase [Cyclobacteriaceae bacterium]